MSKPKERSVLVENRQHSGYIFIKTTLKDTEAMGLAKQHNAINM